METHQTLVQFGLPQGQRLFPNDFREMLARCNDIGIAPALFHRDSLGMPASGMPRVLVVGGVRWVGLLAQPGASDLVRPVIGPALGALGAHFQQPLRAGIRRLSVGLSPTDYPVRYRLREIALKIRHDSTHRTALDDLIRQRVSRGLVRTGFAWGLDVPDDDRLEIDIAIRRQRGVPLTVSTGRTREWLTVVDADLSMFCELKGMWSVGNLTSRGYGRLIREIPAPRASSRIANFQPAVA